jgi:N-formylglutamate amidohydrolase
MVKTRYFISSLFFLIPLVAISQAFPDSVYYGTKDYIKVMTGNMPLVISIPHGGYLLPDEIPDRPCENCAKNQDVYTIEIGCGIRDAIFYKTGFYPFVIINNLHRTRLDPNRNIAEAASGNKNAELIWTEFQNSIDSSIKEVQKRFGKGLYIDLHGHRHEIKRIEIGYLLSSEELQLEDEMINSGSFLEYSSIRNLVENNPKSLSYSELVRGRYSLGSMIEDMGYECVPSQKHPSPNQGEPYFSGGYNTTRHGSSEGGKIDGIQIEIDEELRSDVIRRDRFASDLASVLLGFLKMYYY